VSGDWFIATATLIPLEGSKTKMLLPAVESSAGLEREHPPASSVRDTVLYSVLAAEGPDVKRHLMLRLARHESQP